MGQVQRLAEALHFGAIREWRQAYLPGGGTGARPIAASVFGALPILLGATLPQMQRWGLWPTLPVGWEYVPKCHPYPPGRQVWVKA